MKKNVIAISLALMLTSTIFMSCAEEKETITPPTVVKEFTEQNISVKKTELINIQSEKLTQTLTSKNESEGIFCFTVTDSANPAITQEYLLFNGIDKGFKDIDFSLDGNSVKVTATSAPDSTTFQEIYILEHSSESKFDSIEISLTKEDGTVTIFEF